MPNSGPVPSVPDDWDAQEAQGTPYLLGVSDGVPTWRPVVVFDPVYAEDGSLVTADDRPVFTE